MALMRTLLPDPPPAPFDELLRQRRRWGADTHDEVWEGVLHMAPAPHCRHADLQAQMLRLLGQPADAAGLRALGDFSLGEAGDYRVPDAGLGRPGPGGVYLPTAPLVVEILSPGDETWRKLDFYAEHRVEELLIVDPDKQRIEWLGLSGEGEYRPVARSRLIDLGPAALSERVDWPAIEP